MNLNTLFENLSPQQRQVGQLPAEFKPRDTSPVLDGPYGKENATQGYLVGEGAGDNALQVGDPVIITGDVEYQGRTGDVREIGRDGAFVVVDLYNYGPYSFHASDVSLNDYADSDEEDERAQGVTEGDVFRRHGKNRNPTIDELEMWIKNWTSYQIGGNLTDAGRAKVGQSIAKAQRLLAKKKQQQGVTEAATGSFDYDQISAMPMKDRLTLYKTNPELKNLYNAEFKRRVDAELNNYAWMTPEEKAQYEKLAAADINDMHNKAFSAEKYLKQLFQKKVDAKKAASMLKVHWAPSKQLESFLQGKVNNKIELSAYLAPNTESLGKTRWNSSTDPTVGIVLDGHITIGGRGDLGSDQYKMTAGQRGQQKYVSRPGQIDPTLSMDTTRHHEVLVDNWKIKEIVLPADIPPEVDRLVQQYKIPVRRLSNQQGVAEAALKGTAKEYAAKAQAAEAKYLKYEDLVDQELQKLGQRLPQSWDAGRMNTKLSSHPKYALALKYYTLSEKFASQAIRYERLAKKKSGVTETALRDKADLVAKRRALQDLSRDPGVDQKAVQQRQQDLEKEARSRGLNEFALDDGDDPTEDYPCYDCGSTIFLHHTKMCDLAEPNAKRDLPAKPGTQYWTGQVPKGLAPIPGLAESMTEDSTTKKLSGATPAPAPNPYLKDILMRHIDEVRHFVNTGYIDPTRPMFEELYEYFANEIPDSVRRNPARLERRIGDMIAPHAKFYASAKSMNEQGVAEGKIKLSTDPNWYGAEVGDYKASGPVVNIPANRLVGFEPDDKMNQPASKANVEKIVAGLKQGAKLPPLMVRQYKNGYQVLDGHHRFWAYKLLGVKSIPAQVVPAEDIEEITKQGVAEGLNEMDKSAPQPGRDGKVSHSTYGSRDKKGSDYFKGKEAPGKPVTTKQMSKDALDILKKQGVAEGVELMTDAEVYRETLGVLALMGAGFAAGAYAKIKDIIKMYNADQIMRALEGYSVSNISDDERQALTKLIAEFKQAMAQRQGKQALSIAKQIKTIATDRPAVAEGWKDVVAGGAMALGALGASAQSMPNIDTQQVELTNKYYKVLVQRAVEDGRTLDARTKNLLMAKAQDAAAQKNQKSTAQTAQTTPQFPSQGSEQRRAKDFDQFESTDIVEAKMSPQQQNDFDRMRHGAMSRKEYDARWKKPQKSDDQVIYGKKPKVAEAGFETEPVKLNPGDAVTYQGAPAEVMSVAGNSVTLRHGGTTKSVPATAVSEAVDYAVMVDESVKRVFPARILAENYAAQLQQRRPQATVAVAEQHTTEDVVSDVKDRVGDYLQNVADAVKKDPELLDKITSAANDLGPAVKTLKTVDGHEIKIHGNEDDGFRISISNKALKARFPKMEHAVMATEMYCARRQQQETNSDYLPEA